MVWRTTGENETNRKEKNEGTIVACNLKNEVTKGSFLPSGINGKFCLFIQTSTILERSTSVHFRQ